MNSFEVVKATGEREKFKLSKLKRSLSNAGAQPVVINTVINHLDENGYFRDGISTKKIYREAYRVLKQSSKRVAGRYKLKEALLEMGPSGYPFEMLIAEVFNRLGYSTQIGTVVQGHCVSHEIDVIAESEQDVFVAECKFHNRQTRHCNVTIPLYVQSRFEDVKHRWNSEKKYHSKTKYGYLITNTRFTDDAITYAECKGMKLLSWDYPEAQGLRVLLEKTQIHPITVLSSLTKKEKSELLKRDIIHCQQIFDEPNIIDPFRFNHAKKSNILSEVDSLIES
ncbi:MAG TPA: restriction endonuclease [Gracilimonas sp.]|uniref:restriction endonuclease n=1 Tax=Gracilimonas sp. TaxID=1974203 RepID=UPI002D8434B1|nr:restriction endonuclease [Gracilimonas sp.]